MATWKATVTNPNTKKETVRYGTDCSTEQLAFTAVQAAEYSTPLGDLPDSWDIKLELVKAIT